MKLLILIYILLLLLCEALSDGLAYRKKNAASHNVKALLYLLFLLLPLLRANVWLFILVYVCLRFALFNYLYNRFARLKWTYLSKEVIPDKYLLRIPLFHLLFMQFIIGFLGIAIIINEF